MHPRILFIGEPLKEYVATLEPDDTLSNQTFLGFAGDLVPNMASYTRRAATRLGANCAIEVLTAVGTALHSPALGPPANLWAES